VTRPAWGNASWGASRQWIISPGFDLLFFSNLWWLVLLLPPTLWAEGAAPLEFWQVYFLTTPHRWITLLLVGADADRRQGRTWLFVLIAIVAGVCVLGVRFGTGAFTCLALVDFVWNAWHFGSQHGGIVRIYARKTGGGRPRLEINVLRLFVVYVSLRLAGWTTGWTEEFPTGAAVIRGVDLVVFSLPVFLFVLDGFRRPTQRLGKLFYLASVTALYGGLLFSVRDGHHAFVAVLALASAAYHAVEYMAIVTYYAWRRCEHGDASPFRSMARYWWQVLAAFVLVLGIMSDYADRKLYELWYGLNLWAAFLHYSYDGMIWKLRRPQTAQTLGVELPDAGVAGAAGR
jgi:hypothetical protein